MKTMWRGAISFGLVSIPVRVYTATEEKTLRFNQLHEKDHGRIKYKRVCAKDGEEVPFDEIVKGYEYEKDRYVILTDEELESVPVESTRTIDIAQFVEREEIDPIYYKKTYYLGPEEAGVKAYQLLREALREGEILVDATVPLAAAVSGKATRLLGVPQGSAAEQAQEMVSEGVTVVSALHTVSAASLRNLDQALDEDVLVAGDRRADKRRVAELLDAVDGLRCVDCGRLEMARVTEAMTALMISVNGRYKTHAGVRLTGLPAELWPAT